MKVLNLPPVDITLSEMKDGEIAIITQWGIDDRNHAGDLVQRYGNCLVRLGRPHGNGWSDIFRSDGMLMQSKDYRVRVLPKGTKLEI